MPSATKTVQVQAGHIISVSGDAHAKDVKVYNTGRIDLLNASAKLILNQ